MATLTLSDVSAALSQLFQPQITSQINTTAVGLNLIAAVNGGGKNAAWTAKFTGRTDAAGYVEGADMADGDFDSEVRQDAVLPWAQYRKGAKLSGLAQAAAASNEQSGSLMAAGVSDLFHDELGDANERMARGLGSDLYAGDGSAGNPMVGLAAAVDDGVAVYATIDPAVRTEWVSESNSVVTASLSFSVIRTLLRDIYVASGKQPDLMLTDPVTFDLIADLFGNERRWMDKVRLGGGTPMGAGRLIKLSGGHNVLEFDGIPIARDAFCTANTIYALNSRHIQLKQLPAHKSPMTPARFVELMFEITGERLPEEALGEFMAAPGTLVPYVEMLGQLGDSERAQIKVYTQLCVDRRNVHGKLTLT
jgi:hypothetical protein